MTRQEFLDQVLRPLDRLTAEEREDVRRELEEHVEDRMEALLDMGWDEALAESRCLEAMGDPAEIGREMARQYRGWWWLWIGRAAMALTVVLCVQALLGLGLLIHARNSLEARLCPAMESQLEVEAAAELVDLRMDVGNDVLRVFRVSVGRQDGKAAAEIAMCVYDRWPFGIAVDNLHNKIQFAGYEPERFFGGNGRGNYGAYFWQTYVPIEPGQKSVTLVYDCLGVTNRMEIPLPEQEGTP